MNSWQIVSDTTQAAALQALGWHLWQREDDVFGTVYQSSTRDDLTPKSRSGYLDINLLMATKKHTQFIH
jgi:hypothetical protein